MVMVLARVLALPIPTPACSSVERGTATNLTLTSTNSAVESSMQIKCTSRSKAKTRVQLFNKKGKEGQNRQTKAIADRVMSILVLSMVMFKTFDACPSRMISTGVLPALIITTTLFLRDDCLTCHRSMNTKNTSTKNTDTRDNEQ